MVMVTAGQPTLTPLLDDGLPPLRLLRPDGDTPEWDEGVQGEVRDYAGGQRASVGHLNSDSTILEQTLVTDAAGVQRLRAMRGQQVCYRDGLGGKLWGVFYRHPWTPSPDGRLRYVTLTLASLTVTDEA